MAPDCSQRRNDGGHDPAVEAIRPDQPEMRPRDSEPSQRTGQLLPGEAERPFSRADDPDARWDVRQAAGISQAVAPGARRDDDRLVAEVPEVAHELERAGDPPATQRREKGADAENPTPRRG